MPAKRDYPPPVMETAIRSHSEVARMLKLHRNSVRRIERQALEKIGKAVVRWCRRNETTVYDELGH